MENVQKYLGKEYKDTMTGFIGKCVEFNCHVSGEIHILLQSKAIDNDLKDSHWFYIGRLELVTEATPDNNDKNKQAATRLDERIAAKKSGLTHSDSENRTSAPTLESHNPETAPILGNFDDLHKGIAGTDYSNHVRLITYKGHFIRAEIDIHNNQSVVNYKIWNKVGSLNLIYGAPDTKTVLQAINFLWGDLPTSKLDELIDQSLEAESRALNKPSEMDMKEFIGNLLKTTKSELETEEPAPITAA